MMWKAVFRYTKQDKDIFSLEKVFSKFTIQSSFFNQLKFKTHEAAPVLKKKSGHRL